MSDKQNRTWLTALEDRLRDGFMAAYRNRVGEDSPEHSEINA